MKIPSKGVLTGEKAYWCADDDILYRCEWRIPNIGESYFRDGSNHVAVLRNRCSTNRWVCVDLIRSVSGETNKVTIQDGTRKVRVSEAWL